MVLIQDFKPLTNAAISFTDQVESNSFIFFHVHGSNEWRIRFKWKLVKVESSNKSTE